MSKKTEKTKRAPMSDKEYAQDRGGGKCPYCGSENIEGQPDGELDGQSYWTTVICMDCHKRWRDIYLLHEYSSLDECGRECATPGKPGEGPSMKFSKKPSGKNHNCMEGRICPKCGNETKLVVEVKTVVALLDDGTDDTDSDAIDSVSVLHEFDDDSLVRCPKCNFNGVMRDFQYPKED